MKIRFLAAIASLASLPVIAAVGGYASAQTAQPPKVAPSIAAADREFMMKAASGDMTEIEVARMALTKATSPEVKKHAQHMIDDHTKSSEELKGIASKKGVMLPGQPDPKHKELIDKMRGLSGDEFDKEYIREAGLKAHTEMQTLMQNESTSGEDPEVKAFAQKTLPVVEEHLDHSKKLAAAAGVSASVPQPAKPGA